jgi:cellulose synthase/poly-beta-1,6-N-acetylglucosamine synthase-like glycosyltransferase
MILVLITTIFLILYAILFYYYSKGWKAAGKISSVSNDEHFISVIVAARNEEKYIGRLIDALKNQTYQSINFEIIIVDDYSTDNTSEVVKSRSISNLQLIQPNVSSDLSSKKKSIEAGIAKAKGELIVTTDADCIPPADWLQSINNLYADQKASFIAAPVKFTNDNSLLQIFQSIDFLTLQGITASSVTNHTLTMCNGANLAYLKKSFEEVNGFDGIDHVATGDDMLLMYKIWKKDPSKVFYLKDENAIVVTEPMKTWKEFFMQRKRWASKTLVYDDKRIIFVLAFVYLFNCLFIALLIAALFNPFYWWSVVGYLLLKTLIEFPFVYSVTKFFKEEKIMKYFFPLQPIHIFYTVVVGLLSQFGNYEWKGRRTK